jgi:hypothetical protein
MILGRVLSTLAQTLSSRMFPTRVLLLDLVPHVDSKTFLMGALVFLVRELSSQTYLMRAAFMIMLHDLSC